MSDNFDRWLEDELGSRLGRLDGGDAMPRYRSVPAAPRRRSMVLLSGLPAALTTKAAAAGIALVAATGTGIAVKAATTGTANPLVWGQQVSDHVQVCKDQRTDANRGIGECVSQFAKQHGEQQRAKHAAGEATETPHPHPTPHATGHSDSHPTPPGTPNPAGTPNASPHGNSGSAPGQDGQLPGQGHGKP